MQVTTSWIFPSVKISSMISLNPSASNESGPGKSDEEPISMTTVMVISVSVMVISEAAITGALQA